MNVMLRGTHKKVVFQNITPTTVELSSLPLQPGYVQSRTAQNQTPHAAASRVNDSDDDFEAPPIAKQTKGKQKNIHCRSPEKKSYGALLMWFLRKSRQQCPKRHLLKGISSVKHQLQLLKSLLWRIRRRRNTRHMSPRTHQLGFQLEKKSNDAAPATHSSSKSCEPTISREEFEQFRTFVREDFQDLKKMMHDNFKALLQEMRTNKNDDKVSAQKAQTKFP